MRITIPVLENQNIIPVRYTCKGININPPLHIYEIPENAKSLCVIMYDPDAPGGDFVHWVAYNIEPVSYIEEGSNPGIHGRNDFGMSGYVGPCPPSGVHRYIFKLFALDNLPNITENRTRNEVHKAIQGHILSTGELIAKFGSAK